MWVVKIVDICIGIELWDGRQVLLLRRLSDKLAMSGREVPLKKNIDLHLCNALVT